jgi:hydrogenase nickel incorporation protein HypA/HybF
VHELSIAMSIVEMAEQEAELRGGAQIVGVHLKIGDLAGVVKEALISSFELATQETALAGSRLLIESVPVRVHCSACGRDHTLRSIQNFCCPQCGIPTSDITQGKELEVVALEIMQ